MLTKLRVRLAAIVTCAVLIAASAGNASELNDCMQLFFDGDFKVAQQRLTAMIQQGQADARVHYYRGLASARLGDARAADADYRIGAELEVAGRGTDVGLALQRVQGLDRLRLEKFRRMARLRARQRVQPIAPKPIFPEEDVQLTVAAVKSSVSPSFRLASEVPLRHAAQADPFADDSAGLLAAEPLPGAPEVPTTDAPAPDDEGPVGTGVADRNAVPSEATTELDGGFDVFAEDPFAETGPPVEAPSPRSGKSTGIFGAVFRAIRKATIPQLNPGAMLPGMGPPAGRPRQPPVNRFPEESFPQDDPFQNDDGGDEDFGGDETDPFGL